jgi:hypothetical protein
MRRETLSVGLLVSMLVSMLAFMLLVLSGCTAENAENGSADSASASPSDQGDASPMEEFRLKLIADRLPEAEAGARTEGSGYSWRVGEIDGEPQAVTMDYREDRLTFTVENGIVTDAVWG